MPPLVSRRQAGTLHCPLLGGVQSAPRRRRRWRPDSWASQVSSRSTYHSANAHKWRCFVHVCNDQCASGLIDTLGSNKSPIERVLGAGAAHARLPRTPATRPKRLRNAKLRLRTQLQNPGDLRPPAASDHCAGAAATTPLARTRPAGLPKPSESLAREGSIPIAESSSARARP